MNIDNFTNGAEAYAKGRPGYPKEVIQKIDYVKLNADAWTNVKEGLERYGTAISHEEYMAAVNGELKVTLAGIKIVPQEWFPELKELIF